MNAGRDDAVVRYVRTFVESEKAARIADFELLERFITRNDEDAFSSLVRRHGPMVMRVCQRILRNNSDAEDVFQATFLVLCRKASSIRRRDSVASWLYGVAYHVALKAKARAECRDTHESRAARPGSGDLLAEISVREAHEILNRELAQLPERYRVPLVLCYLEGLTRDEAAQSLGWPLGTFRSRMDRARELLRGRLARRGVTLGGGFLVSILSDQVAAAAVPAALSHSTVKAAVILAANGEAASVVSAGAIALAEGAVRAMFMNRLRIAIALLLFLGVLGGGLFAQRGFGDRPQAAQGAAPPPPPAVPAPGRQDNKKPDEKQNPATGAVDIRFADESSLKVTLREELIPIVTPYGTLRVPVANVRQIDFATRVPPDVARRIAAAIADLGSEERKVRELAAAVLLKQRDRAYPALLEAAKSKDADVVGRAEELLQRLRETVPEGQVLHRKFDMVHTEDMVIAGRIDAATWRVGTAQFGDVEIKLVDLRSLRLPAATEEVAEILNVLPDPGTLVNFTGEVGKKFVFRVTGAIGSVIWGTDVYTADSSLAQAAIHAGILKVGQTGIVRVEIVESLPAYVGSTRNGVTSSAFAAFNGAYKILK